MDQYESGFVLSSTYAVEAKGEQFVDGHGNVSYKGADEGGKGDTVWVKVIEKRRAETDERVEKEVTALKMLRKVNAKGCEAIVDFLQSQSKYYIVTATPPRAISLLEHIQQQGVYTEQTARAVFKSVAKAVESMHRSRVCHRSLSLENIWLRDPSQTDIFVVDFSSASTAQPHALLSELPALNSFTAPEILAQQLYTAEAADVWSLGVVLYSLLVGKLPFSNAATQDGLLRSIRLAKGRPVFPPSVSEDAQELISGLLKICPDDRPATVSAILQHPWLESSALSPSASTFSQRSSASSDSETLPSTPGGALSCISPSEL